MITPEASDLLCGSICREDLLSRIEKKLDRTSLWKVAGIAVAATSLIWGILFAFFSLSHQQMVRAMQENITKVTEVSTRSIQNSMSISVMEADLRYLKTGQEKLEKAIQEGNSKILREIDRLKGQ